MSLKVKMFNKKTSRITLLSAIIVFSLTFYTFLDYLSFKSVIDNETEDSWYEHSWFRSPFKRTVFMFMASQEHWKFNYDRSQRWRVIEYRVSNTTFWSILERHDIPKEEQLKLQKTPVKAQEILF